MADPGQLLLQRAARIDVDRQRHVVAFLPDHGFEQPLLAAEPRIDRGLRAADHADDLVDRDVVVALLEKQRRGHAHDALAARIGCFGELRLCSNGLGRIGRGSPSLRFAPHPFGLRPGFLNRHRIYHDVYC